MADEQSSAMSKKEEYEDLPVFTGVPDQKGKQINPMSWIGTVNFAQGFQYAIVIQLFIVIFKTMGVPNGPAVFWASFLSVPWTFKPLWGPLIDRYWTKRNWTILMQFVVGLCLLAIAIGFILPPGIASLIPEQLLLGYQPFFIISIIFLTIMGFASATHDIACDGYYMLALTEKQQAFFVGVRSTAFRIALILVNGAIVLIAYAVQENTGPPPQALSITALPPTEEAEDSEDTNKTKVVDEESLVVLGESPLSILESSAFSITSNTDDEKRQIVLSPENIIDTDLNTTTTIELNPDTNQNQLNLVVKGQPVGGAIDEEHYYDGEPTEEINLLVSDEQLSAESEEKVTAYVNITKEPAEDEIIAVTVRVAPEGGFFYRIVFPSDAKGMTKDVERLEFRADDWREGKPVTFTMPKILENQESIAVNYQVAAGNIAMSWAVTLGFCAMLYFLIVGLHLVAMPRPLEDMSAETKTPFIIPLLSIVVAIAIPLYLFFTLKGGIEFTRDSLFEFFSNAEEVSDTWEKGFDFVFHTTKFIIILGGAALALWLFKSLREFTKKFFKAMSDVSTIGFYDVFSTFFQKKGMAITLAFLLTFRLGEAQLAQLKVPFLIDPVSDGGLALSLGKLAYVNTVYYLLPLTIGGILSGTLIGLYGLKRMIWICVFFMHAPNALYILLAMPGNPPSEFAVNAVVTAEAFGYGFGFAAYLMVMIIAAQGKYKTAHYALCTGFMALGYMIPGLWAGFLQDVTGYFVFFILVVFFSLPGLIFIPWLPIDENFGKKKPKKEDVEEAESS